MYRKYDLRTPRCLCEICGSSLGTMPWADDYVRIYIENANGSDVTLTCWSDSDCGLLKSRIARLLGIPAAEINFGFKVYSMKPLHVMIGTRWCFRSSLECRMFNFENSNLSKTHAGLYTTSANII